MLRILHFKSRAEGDPATRNAYVFLTSICRQNNRPSLISIRWELTTNLFERVLSVNRNNRQTSSGQLLKVLIVTQRSSKVQTLLKRKLKVIAFLSTKSNNIFELCDELVKVIDLPVAGT